MVVAGHTWGVLKTQKRQVTFDGDFRGFHICRWIAAVGARWVEGKKGRRQDEEEGLFMSGIKMPLGEP